MSRLYLDVCRLNRPFDDQTQDRLRLETEAVAVILPYLQTREWEWISSEVVDEEIGANTDPERRSRLQVLASFAYRRVVVGPKEGRRAEELERLGFQPYDALHIACAENGGALILLTTDDQLLSAASRRSKEISVRVENPLTWLRKVVGKWTFDA